MEDTNMATARTHRHHHHAHADDRHPRKSSGLAGEGANGDNSKRSPAVRPTTPPAKMKKAQVVYYLTRNGHLEHPHFMEVPHLPTLPLRLKDVMDRLTALRGKVMPSLYSWSCKRCYKNGYVWNDLLENDAIHPPVDGTEYVLKGSEIVESCSERIQPFDVRNGSIINCNDSDRHSKRLVATRGDYSSREEEEQEYEGQDAFEDEEKTSYTSSTASRCSRGISTDELDEHEHQVSDVLKKQPSNEQASLLSTLPSPTMILNHKPTNATSQSANNMSSRFSEIIDQQDVPRFAVGRNSVLLQLISCGNAPKPFPKSARDDYYSNDLHKVVARKNTAKAVIGEEDEATMIVYMSENPRFGNLQSEEKEYFSGSIVESIKHDRGGAMTEPVLKKSNSYNAERGTQSQVGNLGIEEKAVVEERRDKSTAKSKCIPRMICSSASKMTKKR